MTAFGTFLILFRSTILIHPQLLLDLALYTEPSLEKAAHKTTILLVSGSLPIAHAEDDIDEEAADEDVDVDGDDSKYIMSRSVFFTLVVRYL